MSDKLKDLLENMPNKRQTATVHAMNIAHSKSNRTDNQRAAAIFMKKMLVCSSTKSLITFTSEILCTR
ncbi:hypothetical protein T265_11826 [Opisthorchis viverrini]|uniref:Uncharacterized protein n=1 Tax=Opisthorchis viverrini TaxID=6198 RepID=A0A074Z815_OPIVI|nr:hypothetical protein T265_11826 [Opisthorchis viverrini]KER19385.1 hypothetical protein T265_11826 [Opisthorchis viverrini]